MSEEIIMNTWPKKIPELTEEQIAIKKDWVAYWLNAYGKKFEYVEKFNHSYPAEIGVFPHCKTLEVGAGLGDHLKYEDFSSQEYTALEIVPEYAKIIKDKYPQIKVINEDCQKRLPFEANYFDRILAIHVLEHLSNLPSALDEFARILKKEGKFIAIIPCEGGWLYSLVRQFSSKRMFERRYKQKYDWLIQSDHLSNVKEILIELNLRFDIDNATYFPLRIPTFQLNLCIGLTMENR